LCKYSIQLNQGMIVASGLAKDVVIEYEKA